MSSHPNGELIPLGGGDPIPLIRSPLKIGRRESCDISLRFPNISGEHSELMFIDGCWQISDLDSTNGTKVNGIRVQSKRLRPGDEIGFANRRFTIQYDLTDVPAESLQEESEEEDLRGISLMEKAGLVHRRHAEGEEPRLMTRPPSKE